jgi:hypothetical protein
VTNYRASRILTRRREHLLRRVGARDGAEARALDFNEAEALGIAIDLLRAAAEWDRQVTGDDAGEGTTK